MNAGQILVIGLSVALALWLAGGIWYNRRQAQEIWRWLEPGLKVLGGRVETLRFSPSGAGLQATVVRPSHPFRRVEVIVRLESRENLPLWLFERLQGRRDRFILRGWLRSPRRGELLLTPADSPLGKALQSRSDSSWRRTPLSPQWVVAQRGEVAEAQLEALRTFVDTYGGQLQRLSQRRSEPHLFLQMALDQLTEHSSQQLLNRIRVTATL